MFTKCFLQLPLNVWGILYFSAGLLKGCLFSLQQKENSIQTNYSPRGSPLLLRKACLCCHILFCYNIVGKSAGPVSGLTRFVIPIFRTSFVAYAKSPIFFTSVCSFTKINKMKKKKNSKVPTSQNWFNVYSEFSTNVSYCKCQYLWLKACTPSLPQILKFIFLVQLYTHSVTLHLWIN